MAYPAMMMHAPMGGPFALLGLLFNLLFFVAILALLAWGATRFFSVRQGGSRADSAEEILRERFARGEISAEEYERSYEVLRESQPPRRGYEEYVREAMERLRSRRDEGSR